MMILHPIRQALEDLRLYRGGLEHMFWKQVLLDFHYFLKLGKFPGLAVLRFEECLPSEVQLVKDAAEGPTIYRSGIRKLQDDLGGPVVP